jgi:hypothetical protein
MRDSVGRSRTKPEGAKAPRARSVRARTPKDIAAGIAERAPLDRVKLKQANRRATEAADRLLEEMDDVLRHLDRKR